MDDRYRQSNAERDDFYLLIMFNFITYLYFIHYFDKKILRFYFFFKRV